MPIKTLLIQTFSRGTATVACGNKRYLTACTIVIVVAVTLMLLSLRWRFLDIFVPGSWHGLIGYDFFSIPRSFLNLCDGASIFDTGHLPYGPYATAYYYHPLVSLLVGPWCAAWDNPWIGYLLFVLLSLLLLGYSAAIIARRSDNGLFRRYAFFGLLCTLPTYLMLWNAQMHVFTVISAALILVGLLEIRDAAVDGRHATINAKLIAGLLFSLLSKPMVLLHLPLLLLVDQTRPSTVRALIVYTIISLVCLLLPWINPAGDNLIHWTNIIGSSLHIMPQNIELFSLSVFLNHLLGASVDIGPWAYRVLLLLVLVPAWRLRKVTDPVERTELAVLMAVLTFWVYYLTYSIVWEYHYTTLLPTLPILILLVQHKRLATSRTQRLMASALVALIYLPTPAFLFRQSIDPNLSLVRLFRIGPVVILFALLWRVVHLRLAKAIKADSFYCQASAAN